MESHRILTINPGATSTKIGLFRDDDELMEIVIRHSQEDIRSYGSVAAQYPYRRSLILESLKKKNIDIRSLDAVVGRGGLLHPMESGTYLVSDEMISDLKAMKHGEHASNLGAILAREIADFAGITAFVVDPVSIDEMEPLARISGVPGIKRKSVFHALNQKSVARRASAELGLSYEESNFIVAHMGSGISVGVHSNGKVIDVNDGLYGDGPFSPERSGGVPIGGLVRLCFSGNYTEKELLKKLTTESGIIGYLGTNDCREVRRRIRSGDKYADLIYRALAYQISKEIGSAATVVSGKVDAVILTGGLAHDQSLLVSWIRDRTSFISKVLVYPGEDEMLAMAQGALRVLRKVDEPRRYLREEFL